MASLEHDPTSGHYRVRFRYDGRPYKRSLKTTERREADAVLGRIEETIRLLERGRLEMPPVADPGAFILSDGKRNGTPVTRQIHTLADLFKGYQKSTPKGAKAQTTLQTEGTHRGHLLRHLNRSKVAQTITASAVQTYIDRRLRERYRGRPIRSETVRKEVATLRLIWNWGVSEGYLVGPAPVRGLKYPKTEQKAPCMTRDEIQRIVDRGGLEPDQVAALWDCLFLTKEQIQEVLGHVRENAQQPFILPMFVFTAHTGARRSEILRSRIDDFDFQGRTVLIREKKRDHKRSLTFRRVPMSDLLFEIMTGWFADHPGGQFTISQQLRTARGKNREVYLPVTRSEAHDHFKRTLKGSKWEKIKGFHVFRHSFASNLAAAGVDQRVIDEWMGHQTEEMRCRYRHLFPDQQREAIDSVFGGDGK